MIRMLNATNSLKTPYNISRVIKDSTRLLNSLSTTQLMTVSMSHWSLKWLTVTFRATSRLSKETKTSTSRRWSKIFQNVPKWPNFKSSINAGNLSVASPSDYFLSFSWFLNCFSNCFPNSNRVKSIWYYQITLQHPQPLRYG